MTTRWLYFTILLLLSITACGQAQSYDLDWEDVSTVVHQSDKAYTLAWPEVDKSVQVRVAEPENESVEVSAIEFSEPSSTPMESPDPRPSQLFAPRVHLNLSGHQWYDHYAQRYKLVDRIEVTVYPRIGGIDYYTYENTGGLSQYEVYLKNLSPGDRYEAIVVWDDGSNRTQEGTLQGSGWATAVVNEPNPLAYQLP